MMKDKKKKRREMYIYIYIYAWKYTKFYMNILGIKMEHICINVYKYTNRFRDILLYTCICICIHMKRVRPLGSMATLPPFTASALKRDDSKTTVCGTSAYLCSAFIVFDIIAIYIYIYIIDHFSIYPLYHSYCINIFCLFPCYLMVLNRNSIDSSMTMNHWLYSSWISYAKLVLAPNFSSMLELCRNRSKLVDWFQTK